ncbi:MAG: triose-phosphate isomerase [Actinomycetota bacterium]|nr:triose-phosphate isomerase [Actinomycetota bacterium]
MPDQRRPYMAGNWKMNKTSAEARSYIEEFAPRLPSPDAVDVGLCVPFTALATCVEAVSGTPIKISAQNMHQEVNGSYTGEVSAPMIVELGAVGVVLGHSERRAYAGETDSALKEKVPAALEAGLEPILCVGETEEEREAGEMEEKLRHQVSEDLEQVPTERLSEVVIAYEPVWAIGTGKTATAEEAQEAIAFIRGLVRDRSPEAAERMRVLYGGSVDADSAGEILAQPDVDGALVGGQSLDAEGFSEIVAAAA